MPRFAPIRPIVSYSRGDTIALPSSPPNTFEHLIVHPAIHAWVVWLSPPRLRSKSRIYSPLIVLTPENSPWEKLSVGKPPRVFVNIVIAAVPYRPYDSTTGLSLSA